ncbi:MAG: phage tail protein [Novosphingobium sp.]
MNDPAYYPPPAFAFAVAIVSGAQPQQQTVIDAAFQQISGIDPKVDIEEVAEGGVNGNVHQLPGVTKHSNLVLKRGYVTQQSSLAQWADQTVGSSLGTPIETKVLTVSLLNPDAQPLVVWTFENAWPVKWEVGTFNSQNNEILTETLEIAYATVSRQIQTSSNMAN